MLMAPEYREASWSAPVLWRFGIALRLAMAGTEAKAALSRRLVSPESVEGGSETQAEAQHHGNGRARHEKETKLVNFSFCPHQKEPDFCPSLFAILQRMVSQKFLHRFLETAATF
jgi:hypothetical protein